MSDFERHNFHSAEEAIRFVAETHDAQLRDLHDRIAALDIAVQSLFAGLRGVTHDAQGYANALADAIEGDENGSTPEMMAREVDIAKNVRRLASTEEPRFRVIDGGLSPDPQA